MSSGRAVQPGATRSVASGSAMTARAVHRRVERAAGIDPPFGLPAIGAAPRQLQRGGVFRRRGAHAHDLGLALEYEAITPLVRLGETRGERLRRFPRREGDLEIVPLPAIAHARDMLRASRAPRTHRRLHGGRGEGFITECVQRLHDAHHGHAALGGDGESKRREHPGVRRDEDAGHAERVGEGAGVERAAAAEGDERAAARVDPPFHAHAAQRARHLGVGGGDHRGGGTLRGGAKRRGQAGDRGAGAGGVERRRRASCGRRGCSPA